MTRYFVKRLEDLSTCGRSGEKQAPSSGEMEKCECCGKGIKKVAVMSDGARIGRDCAQVMVTLGYINHSDGELHARGISKRQLRFYLSHTSAE